MITLGCSNRTILSKTTFVGGLGHCDLKLGVRGGASASGRRCGAAPALDPLRRRVGVLQGLPDGQETGPRAAVSAAFQAGSAFGDSLAGVRPTWT